MQHKQIFCVVQSLESIDQQLNIAVRNFTRSTLPLGGHAAVLPPSAWLRTILRALLRAI